MRFQGPFQLDINALEVIEKGSSFYESYVDPIWGFPFTSCACRQPLTRQLLFREVGERVGCPDVHFK